MQLIFGKGDILVTECGNGEQRHILIEKGHGDGKVGSLNTHRPERMPGAVIEQEDIENATCALTFDNPVSLGVMLEKVLVGMVAFRRNGQTIGEENADLGLSIRELCQELLGMKDRADTPGTMAQEIERLRLAVDRAVELIGNTQMCPNICPVENVCHKQASQCKRHIREYLMETD